MHINMRPKLTLITRFREYNYIRYTFVRNLFRSYDMLDDDHNATSDIGFARHLELL